MLAALLTPRILRLPRLARCCASVNLYPQLDMIRNIGISAHVDSGKTTLTERILFYSGKIDQMHEVRGRDRVGAVMDFMQLERERGITIKSAATFVNWRDHHINLIDTPGHVDFTVEVERSLRVLDGAVLVVCASGGVQSQTLTVNRQMKRYNVPFIVFLNKIDRPNSDPYDAFDQLKDRLNYNAALMHLPIGIAKENVGMIDVLNNQAIYFEGQSGRDVVIKAVPDEYKDEVSYAKNKLFEALANVDDEMGELFLNEETPSKDQIVAAIKRTVLNRTFVPVFIGSALRNRGVQLLMDGIVDYLPNPSQVTNTAYLLDVDKKTEESTTTNSNDREPPKKAVTLDRYRNSGSPLVMMAFKLEINKHGNLTYIRIYQGKIQKGDTIMNVRTKKKFRVFRIGRMHADQLEEITHAENGDIIALFGLDCNSGDSFVLENDPQYLLENMYIPEPVMSLSLEVRNTEEVMKLTNVLRRFAKEDPTFKYYTDDETQELIISGMGELHLEIYISRMETEHGLTVTTDRPKVSYRESVCRRVDFDYLHKKQTGGAGQFAGVKGYLEPMPANEFQYIDFVNEAPSNVLARNFVQSIKKGFEEFCAKGPLTGSKITGLRCVLTGGETHVVDSNDLAFKFAIRGAMDQAFKEPDACMVYEPLMSVELVFPIEYQDRLIGRLTEKRASIKTLVFNKEYCIVNMTIPLDEMFGFTTLIRKHTQGKAEYSMEFSEYTAVAGHVKEHLVNSYNRRYSEAFKK